MAWYRSPRNPIKRKLSHNHHPNLLWLTLSHKVVLHRIGPHVWIPAQVIVWGLVEILQCFVTGPGGWYAARLFLGLAESGFLPGALYTLSQWYTQDEITSRTSAFFFGSSVASAFGSLISSGALRLEGEHGIRGWQWSVFREKRITHVLPGTLTQGLQDLYYLWSFNDR